MSDRRRPADEEDLAKAIGAALGQRDRAARLLGMALDEIRPGYARMRMTVREDMVNGRGIGHGAMTFALADSCFAYAGNSRNRGSVAQHCSITFARPTRPGDVLTAVAEERARFGRSGVFDVTVTNQDGDVVALFRGNSRDVEGEVLPGLGDD